MLLGVDVGGTFTDAALLAGDRLLTAKAPTTPDDQRRVADLLDELCDDVHVSTSHETAGVFREYERCATTVVDAALSPLLQRYLERLAERAREAGLPEPEVMLSGGGGANAATAARHRSLAGLSRAACGGG